MCCAYSTCMHVVSSCCARSRYTCRVLLASFSMTLLARFLFATDSAAVDCALHARKNEVVLAFVCIILVLMTCSFLSCIWCESMRARDKHADNVTQWVLGYDDKW